MQRNWRVVIAAALAVSLLTGCAGNQTRGDKKTIGTVIGGVLGGLLGSQVDEGNGKVIATIAGTAIGAYIGNRIGKHLDEKDRQAMAQATHEALTASDQRNSVEWKNPDSGVAGKVTAGPVTLKPAKEAAGALPSMRLINADYQALKNSNLRGRPNTRSNVVGSLKQGEIFRAVGRVEGADWIMVAREGRTAGYVYGPLVAPYEQASAPVTAEVELAQVVECRPIIQEVALPDGRVEEEEVKYCRDDQGRWQKAA